MAEAEGQAAEAAHRQPVDRPAFAGGDGPVGRVNVADQVLGDEVVPVVLLPLVTLGPVDIPRVAAVGHHDDQVEPLGRLRRAHAGPVVVIPREPVEQVQDGIPLVPEARRRPAG